MIVPYEVLLKASTPMNGVPLAEKSIVATVLLHQIFALKHASILLQGPCDNQYLGRYFNPHFCLDTLLPFPASDQFGEIFDKVSVLARGNYRCLLQCISEGGLAFFG